MLALARRLPRSARMRLAPTARPLPRAYSSLVSLKNKPSDGSERQLPEHAVISTFDLFSIGVGPSSSHTVGPMRAGKIFVTDLREMGVLDRVKTVKVVLYGSLAATGKGHHTPQAILMGLEGSDPETIAPMTIPSRYATILETKQLLLGGSNRITFDTDRDMLWRFDQVLPTHPNGMRFTVFDEGGDLLAVNEYFSVGGGFVVNDKTKVDENLFYKAINKKDAAGARIHQQHHSVSDPVTDAVPPPSATGSPPPPPPVTVEGTDTKEEEQTIPYPFDSGASLLALTRKHNMTIAQIVYDNEKSFGYTDDEIHEKILNIWNVMDNCIRAGVSSSERTLPGRLGLRRRAPLLYRRLMRGLYPGIVGPHHDFAAIGPGQTLDAIDGPAAPTSSGPDDPFADPSDPAPSSSAFSASSSHTSQTPFPLLRRRTSAPHLTGSPTHPLLPMPPRKTDIPAVDFLSCYAIAVNEENAAGRRIVTSPTNGAAGVIPAVLKYILEFVADDKERSVGTFLLTAAAIGMLFKRGSTISAAEGGCQAEVGVACSMASAGFAACMGASPETVMQAAEIGIEHNLGLTCDPIDGLVQVPCIERNSLGAVKAVTAAQLSMASDGVYSVTLDEAIEAMRLTAADMSVKYKETSLSGLARTVKIPLTVPAC
ncbi:L-serine ammonia-lyase [Schizophyllum commune H4-8]|uniref:L-serine ammonia-lyase n=1 Tax=Schizophyllum commune (strain H4-8 / FGSC 9210) TaxID=578458 RepID=UPI00215F7EAF|nr:L-serine ammonia-lyase [Schizophyllum commune H4-8]KAI5894971.1 L-serine ammonia-lyase [Schizophyllum commune H4-8]